MDHDQVPSTSNQATSRTEHYHDEASLGFKFEADGGTQTGWDGIQQPAFRIEAEETSSAMSMAKSQPAGGKESQSPIVFDVRQKSDSDAHLGASPFPARSTHHHHHPLHGHSLRSDSYLRQALTSPYNQRTEKHGYTSFSPFHSDRVGAANSPSPWQEGTRKTSGNAHVEKGKGTLSDGIKQWAGEASPSVDQLSVFKTPKNTKRAMFHSPDKGWREKGVSGSSSPSSSASGSSGSGHRLPTTNPFEEGHDRLHFPMFSPNMFNVPQTPGSAEKGTFQWNLEHLAELRPVHIDDKEIKRQMSRQVHDAEAEQRAQRAIDYYFQHHMVAPSPWSEIPPPHVLPVTPAYGQAFESLVAGTPDQAQGSIQKDLARGRKVVVTDKSCQTTLTLPMNVDLEKLLGDYMTYQETERNDSCGRESMSSSSLRRKLFFNADSSSILSPVKSGQRSPDHLSAALCTPPNHQKSTPEWERGSPIHTPSSVQFSSSPIRDPFSSEKDNLRSSFSEHGPLASPELSPIVERKRGSRTRQALVFPTMSSDTEDEQHSGFEPHVRHQLQVEVHDGNSPSGRPSPDVSPIAAFGSGGSGHHSRSRTLRADMSVFSSPAHHQPHSYTSPATLPFSTFAQRGASPTHQVISMDTDAEFLPHKDAGPLSPRDSSMMEVMMGEGGHSGLDPDTLQPPSSLSNLDTGYQTGSGNGSLQTTNEGGPTTTNTSADALSGSVDTGAQLKRLAAVLRSNVNEHGFALRGEGRMGMTDESSVDGMGSSVDMGASVAHSNLTTQFMSMPVGSESATDIADFGVTSLPSLKAASDDMGMTVDGRSDGSNSAGAGNVASRDFPERTLESFSTTDTDLQPENASGGYAMSEVETPKPRADNLIRDGMSILAQDSYFYECSPEFLEKMGDYLEKGESSDEKSDKGTENVTPVATKVSLSRKTRLLADRKKQDDSVIERARQYLVSVNYLQVKDNETGNEEELEKDTAVDKMLMPPPKPLGSSTPTKRLLGKVAEDLTTAQDQQSSPALASEVAKEIMRRAELDLKRMDKSSHRTNNS